MTKALALLIGLGAVVVFPRIIVWFCLGLAVYFLAELAGGIWGRR